MSHVKFSILLIFLSVAQLTIAQHYEIAWEAPQKTLVGNTERFALYFEGAIYKDATTALPSFSIYLPQTNLSSAEIINAKYAALDYFEQKLVQPNISFANQPVSISTGIDHFSVSTFIDILPFRQNEKGEVEKLVSFDLKLNRNKITKSKLVAKPQKTTNSVLATGEWYKIQVTNDGIYKIDKKQLESMGINTSSINPKNIRLFGNGGGMLPQANGAFRYDDLQEDAIWVVGEDDGSFNNNDYILFYGKSQHVTFYDNTTGKLNHKKNIYSDVTYYFINISSTSGKRISSQPSAASPEIIFDYYDDYLYHEKDETLLFKSGREWVGEVFNGGNRSWSFSFDAQNVYSGSTINVTSTFYNTGKQINSIKTILEGTESSEIPLDAVDKTISYGILAKKGVDNSFIDASQLSGSELNIRYNLTSSGSDLTTYLDRVGVNIQRRLQPYQDQVFFQTVESLNNTACGYQIANASSNYFVFDITDPVNVKDIDYTLSGSTISFNKTATDLSRFVLFNITGSFPSPIFIEKTANQNLHTDVNNIPTLLIIAPPFLKDKANEYAQMKMETVGMDARVAITNEIYNEFSCGAQDITAIRDYIRMLYLTNPDKLQYVLLFGDASYDYKNRVVNNTNNVPTYESLESFSNISSSYCSDDFFGFMDETEGEWLPTENNLLDLGIGRFPIKTMEEADAVINKVRQYTTNPLSLGKWRNQIVFVADDGDGVTHINNANMLAEKVDSEQANYNVNKVYLDAFEQLSTPSGQTSQTCIDKLNQKIERGSLIINYTGHGNEDKWAVEGILTKPEIRRLKNIDNLPIFITATCEFGRYDNPNLQSGAEELLFNPGGGGIALLTTTRAVYATSNQEINTSFYNAVFKSNRPLGQVMKDTKNTSLRGTNNRNFTLLGDPSMTLAYPKQRIILDSIVTEGDTAFLDENSVWKTINDTLETNTPLPLKALGLVTLKGTILNEASATDKTFKGLLDLIVYDKESKIKTLGDENGSPYTYLSRENTLYEGKASIENGRFEVSFIVPKDISYKLDFGKISMYAKNTSNPLLDASGGNTEIKIGGTSPNITTDDTPPSIQLYLDDFSFQNGGTVGSSPILLAKLYDQSGINISTAGLGHEIVATIDKNDVTSFILNDFYSSDVNNYKSGLVNFSYKDLEEGKHTLTLRVWDTHNNVNEASIDFVVDYNNATLYSYPNPMTNNANFVIEHSREGIDVELIFDIISPNGREAYHFEKKIINSDLVIDGISWDGTNDYNSKLPTGIYFCRVLLRYADGSTVAAKVHRLVLID